MTFSLKQRQYVDAVIAVLPHLAEAVAAIPPDCQVKAFEAAELSFLRTFRQLGLSGPETWASSIMRRLRRRVREACLTEKGRLRKLYEQLSTNEGLETVPGRAHSFKIHDTGSSGEQKGVGREDEFDQLKLYQQLSNDEQIGLTRSFDSHDETSSRERKGIGKEGAFDKQKAQPQFSADDEVGRDQKNVGRAGQFDVLNLQEQLSIEEQIGQARSFDIHDASLSGEQTDVARESHEQFSGGDQPPQAHSFEVRDIASSEDQHDADKEDVGRESGFDKIKLLDDEQIAQGRSSEKPNEASSGEQEDVGRKGEFDKLNLHEQLSADEQIGRADRFGINDAASSARQKNVGREGPKTAAGALRMTQLLINVGEIFDSGRRVGVENRSMRKRELPNYTNTL